PASGRDAGLDPAAGTPVLSDVDHGDGRPQDPVGSRGPHGRGGRHARGPAALHRRGHHPCDLRGRPAPRARSPPAARGADLRVDQSPDSGPLARLAGPHAPGGSRRGAGHRRVADGARHGAGPVSGAWGAGPTGATPPTTLVEALLAARDEAGTALNDDEILGNVFTLAVAGTESTATTLAWIM